MSDSLSRELARLYRAWYANRISLADYRYQRGILLDSLLGANVDSGDVTQPRANKPELEFVPEQPEVEPPPERRSFRWPYVAGACVVLLAGVVLFVTRQIDEPVPDLAPEAPASTVPAPAAEIELEAEPEPEIVIIPDVGQVLVEEFVARDDWRHASIAEFQSSWGRLPASDRIVAKGAVWFAPLVDQLEYEIAEALEFSSAPDEDERLHHLYQLAINLGLPEMAPDNWKPGRALSAPSVAEQEAGTRAEDAQVPVTTDVANAAAADTGADDTAVAVDNENACSASQLQTRRRGCYDLIKSGQNGPAMRVLPAGESGDGNSIAAFAISVSEISRQEFTRYCEASGVECPEDPWPGKNMPVVNVSWHDANAYCEWLSSETGYRYRLPSETEWEYAARAGVTSDYPFGDEISPGQARYSSITDYNEPLPVEDRTTQRNDFGLWHVVGNVREWVSNDEPGAGDTRSTRGGSYADDDESLRLSLSLTMAADSADTMTGFRIIREL